MMVRHRSEADFENGDEEEAELLQLTENNLDPNYNLNLHIS